MHNEFGCIRVEEFLKKIGGKVIGQILTDAKVRTFEAEYKVESVDKDKIKISRKSGTGDQIILLKSIPLDGEIVSLSFAIGQGINTLIETISYSSYIHDSSMWNVIVSIIDLLYFVYYLCIFVCVRKSVTSTQV